MPDLANVRKNEKSGKNDELFFILLLKKGLPCDIIYYTRIIQTSLKGIFIALLGSSSL